MASVEEVGGGYSSSATIPDKHKAKVSELQEQAQEEIAKLNLPTQSNAVVNALVWNHTPGDMPFQQNKNWSGSVVGQYPNPIYRNKSGAFTHSGRPPTDKSGSYGAVIYIGTNLAGAPNNCAWVLAWHVPGNGTPNKVYVETGPISNYPKGTVDWNKIKASLDRSSHTSYYIDNVTHAEATASITAAGNTVGLGTSFDIKQ